MHESRGPLRVTRLPRGPRIVASLPARNRMAGPRRFAIGLSRFQHPEGGFGQVAGHRHHGFGMALAPVQALIERHPGALFPGRLVQDKAVGGFHAGPLAIVVHVLAHRPPVAAVPPASTTRGTVPL